MIGPNSFACQCTGSWTGTYCTQYVSACKSDYCLNGGTCYEPTPGVAACYCPACTSGNLCQYQFDLCNQNNNPCLNNGYCITNFPFNCSYSCSCNPG